MATKVQFRTVIRRHCIENVDSEKENEWKV